MPSGLEVTMFSYSHLLKEILAVLQSIDYDLHKILVYIQPKPLTAAIAVRFTGATMANSLTLNVGQTSQASIVPLLADGITPSGGVLTNVAYTFSDPSATVVLNADGLTATVTGVAASTTAIKGTATCTVTDTDGVVSTWSQDFTIQTNAVIVPTQLTQSIAVEFTTPVAAGAVGASASLKAGATPVGQRAKVG